MRYRPLGKTGQFVSELCLGTMTFSGGQGFWRTVGTVDQRGATALVARALEAGVNFFDSADVYSEGQSEVLLGQALREVDVRREDVIIATKVFGRTSPGPNSAGLSRGHIMDQVGLSLKRLGTEHIDLYQIHGFDSQTPIEVTLRALDDCVSRGMIRTLGCSNLAAWQIMKALGISERRGFARFETVQAYYNLSNRDLEREIVPLCEDQGLGIMIWSPLAGGLLSGKFTRNGHLPEGARRSTFDFPPADGERVYDLVEAMAPIAKAHDTSVASIALAWLLQRNAVMSVIIGAKTLEQLDDNLHATQVRLSAGDIARLDAISAPEIEYPGWMIEYQAKERSPVQD
ncbi:aldo/keto reductase [Pseudomonas chlororaphis]|uniref:aldo/keto reductase n=1 Tax=Pseudomonas chlororaphis TaxID=587753 RepID=UPI0015DFCA1B|nr:aldo/keto reductase [Pseudomonas chlororaphis]QLL12298.1 aldo/keto reductase [Pseudomonas chlororaphis subsp. aurantiaca]